MTNDAAVADLLANMKPAVFYVRTGEASDVSASTGYPSYQAVAAVTLEEHQQIAGAYVTTVAELRAAVEAWQSQCEGLNESRREEMARADAAERRVADLLQAVRELQIAESDVRIHEAMNPRSRNYRLPIYEAQRQARERLSALTKESP